MTPFTRPLPSLKIMGRRLSRGRPRQFVARYGICVMPVRTVIEHGPKGKRSVAFALDWPGWSRGAKSAELALDILESYRQRYRPITDLARMAGDFDAAGK